MDQERGLFHEADFCLLGNDEILPSLLQALQGNGHKKPPPWRARLRVGDTAHRPAAGVRGALSCALADGRGSAHARGCLRPDRLRQAARHLHRCGGERHAPADQGEARAHERSRRGDHVRQPGRSISGNPRQDPRHPGDLSFDAGGDRDGKILRNEAPGQHDGHEEQPAGTWPTSSTWHGRGAQSPGRCSS